MALGIGFAPRNTEAFAGYTYQDASGKNFIYNSNTAKTYAYQPPTGAPQAEPKDDFPTFGSVNSQVNPAPIIYSITPDKMERGKGKLVATINGANFISGSIVKWNSSDRETTFIDSNRLIVKLTAEDMNGNGEYLVRVWNPAPLGGYSNAIVFTLGDGHDLSKKTSNDSALMAGAIGGVTFMPRTLLQWLMFIILILLFVVLWRRLYVTKEQKEAHLKHS